jgi:hypothetical protein
MVGGAGDDEPFGELLPCFNVGLVTGVDIWDALDP